MRGRTGDYLEYVSATPDRYGVHIVRFGKGYGALNPFEV